MLPFLCVLICFAKQDFKSFSLAYLSDCLYVSVAFIASEFSLFQPLCQSNACEDQEVLPEGYQEHRALRDKREERTEKREETRGKREERKEKREEKLNFDSLFQEKHDERRG